MKVKYQELEVLKLVLFVAELDCDNTSRSYNMIRAVIHVTLYFIKMMAILYSFR